MGKKKTKAKQPWKAEGLKCCTRESDHKTPINSKMIFGWCFFPFLVLKRTMNWHRRQTYQPKVATRENRAESQSPNLRGKELQRAWVQVKQW